MKVNADQNSASNAFDKKRNKSSVVLLWLMAIFTYIWMILTMSSSGHTSIVSSIGIVPAFVFACHIFFHVPRSGYLERLLGSVAFSVTAIIFIVNVYNIIWS
jgi:heme/copper-type cytochrome/quinol oxidase subunit 4